MSQVLTSTKSVLLENIQTKYVTILEVEILTVDNLKIVGNLTHKFPLNDRRQNLQKLGTILCQESKYLHLTEVKLYKGDRELSYQTPFFDIPKSQIMLLRLTLQESE
jgi:hypothetical protein